MYAEYRASPSPELERELVQAMKRHGYAVVWQQLHENHPDIVNYSIFKALAHSDGFLGESKFSTWFQTIVTNLCRKHLRQKTHRQEVPLEEDTATVAGPPTLYMELTKDLDAGELRLLELILAGYEKQEIAQMLGVARITVQRQWPKLQAKLRRRYARTG